MTCPCYSGKPYATCCEPYHKGESAPTPLALMRSRYSAYALGKVDYILATTHPDHPDSSLPLKQRQKQISLFCQSTQFTGLDILEAHESTVTFRAHLLQQGKDISFTEKSEFAQVNGRWLYLRPLEII